MQYRKQIANYAWGQVFVPKPLKQILSAAVLLAALVLTVGCGGGGGGSTDPSGVVITGTVKSYQDTNQAVPNATVTIATYSAKSDSTGKFRIVMAENVMEPTFTVAPPTGYLSWWAYYGGKEVKASAIPTPLPLYNGKDLGTIQLWDIDSGGPPPGPFW